jgi:hypothetical protein
MSALDRLKHIQSNFK